MQMRQYPERILVLSEKTKKTAPHNKTWAHRFASLREAHFKNMQRKRPQRFLENEKSERWFLLKEETFSQTEVCLCALWFLRPLKEEICARILESVTQFFTRAWPNELASIQPRDQPILLRPDYTVRCWNLASGGNSLVHIPQQDSSTGWPRSQAWCTGWWKRCTQTLDSHSVLLSNISSPYWSTSFQYTLPLHHYLKGNVGKFFEISILEHIVCASSSAAIEMHSMGIALLTAGRNSRSGESQTRVVPSVSRLNPVFTRPVMIPLNFRHFPNQTSHSYSIWVIHYMYGCGVSSDP